MKYRWLFTFCTIIYVSACCANINDFVITAINKQFIDSFNDKTHFVSVIAICLTWCSCLQLHNSRLVECAVDLSAEDEKLEKLCIQKLLLSVLSSFRILPCRLGILKSIFKVWNFMGKQKTSSLEKIIKWESRKTKIMSAWWSLTTFISFRGKSIGSEIRFRNYKSIAHVYNEFCLKKHL